MDQIDATMLVKIQKERLLKEQAAPVTAPAQTVLPQPSAGPYPLKGVVPNYPLKGKV
jgi:hypothetical protein